MAIDRGHGFRSSYRCMNMITCRMNQPCNIYQPHYEMIPRESCIGIHQGLGLNAYESVQSEDSASRRASSAVGFRMMDHNFRLNR